MECLNMIRIFKAGEATKSRPIIKKVNGKDVFQGMTKVKHFNEDVNIRCGTCYACRITRLRSWIMRLKIEEEHSCSSFFITLTYDSLHVPYTPEGDMTLDKTHYQKFMKLLRKTQKKKLSYVCVGEYGSEKDRPHYHLLLFNLDVKSNELWQVQKHLQKFWEHGNVHVGTVTNYSIAYVMEYIQKNRIQLQPGQVQEFSTFSKGIGSQYITPERRRYHLKNIGKVQLSDHNEIYPMARYIKNALFTETEREQQNKILVKNIKKEKEELISKIGFDQYQEKRRQAKLFYHFKQLKNDSSKKNGITH